MTTEITRCSYSSKATEALKELNPDQLKQASINATIGKIVTKYLQYEGDDVYTVNIKNGLVNFSIEGLDDETRTLQFEAGKWKLIQGSTTTEIDEESQPHIAADITRVLERVRNVATATLPTPVSSTPALSAPQVVTPPPTSPASGNGGVVVNLYVNGQSVSSGSSLTSSAPMSVGLTTALQQGLLEGSRAAERTDSPLEETLIDARPSMTQQGVALVKTGGKKLLAGSLSVASSVAKKTVEKARELTAKQWAGVMGTMVLMAGLYYIYSYLTTVSGTVPNPMTETALCIPHSTLEGHC